MIDVLAEILCGAPEAQEPAARYRSPFPGVRQSAAECIHQHGVTESARHLSYVYESPQRRMPPITLATGFGPEQHVAWHRRSRAKTKSTRAASGFVNQSLARLSPRRRCLWDWLAELLVGDVHAQADKRLGIQDALSDDDPARVHHGLLQASRPNVLD